MTTKPTRLFLDIHAIQSLPPSNINRDDTGSPKTAQYGGVRRARVSSQSWKRAMREYFYEHSEEESLGTRTKRVIEYVAKEIISQEHDISEKDATKLSKDILKLAGVPTNGKVLFFIGNEEAEKLAKAAIEQNKDKKSVQEILKTNPALDVVLFGRMVADDKDGLGVNAVSQVAHALSTHAAQTEFDYFTALDDFQSSEESGAAHLDTVEFNSSTLYRYANVAVHELLKQLDDKESVLNALKLFVSAFANSLPTGKVNTFANQTLPQALVVTVRTDRPVNLISAFETPVKSSAGYVGKSIDQLAKEMVKVEKMVQAPAFTFYVSLEEAQALSEIATEKASMPVLLEDLVQDLANLM